MRRIREILAAVSLLGTSAAEAQTAEEVVSRNLEALGGRPILESVRDVRLTGSAVMPGTSPMDLVIEWKRPSKCRIEFRARDVRIVQAFNGQSAWQLSPNGDLLSELRMEPADVQSIRKAAAEFLGILVNMDTKTVKVEGTAEKDGREAIRVAVTSKDGSNVIGFLDPKTFLFFRQESVIRVGGVDYPSITELTDYRKVGGIAFPLVVKTRPKDAHAGIEMRIRDIWTNSNVPDERFESP